jgi:hypothetical protein
MTELLVQQNGGLRHLRNASALEELVPFGSPAARFRTVARLPNHRRDFIF